jgi:hypothetical protein
VSQSSGQRPWFRRPWWLWLGLSAFVAATAVLPFVLQRGSSLSARDRRWQQDIAYLVRELPRVHIDGLGSVPRSVWEAAGSSLEAQVPQLSEGQVIVGMARMVAMLHDDETQLTLPRCLFYPLLAQWLGSRLYLVAVPSTDRPLVGTQLVAIDGHPISQVLAQLRSVIDYQDPGVLRAEQATDLTNAMLLYWLGITRSSGSAVFTVRATSGHARAIRLVAGPPVITPSTLSYTLPASVDHGRTFGISYLPTNFLLLAGPQDGIAHVPLPLYLHNLAQLYWLQILPGQRAVYLKYNLCLPGDQFQQLAGRALAVLRAHQDYRLIIDLRNNPGGDSAPFQMLVTGIQADPAINRRGRIFGLINPLTNSSATVDAYNLRTQTNALLIGQQVRDPIDEFGNDYGELKLPGSQLSVQYTTAVINGSKTRYGAPDIVVAPTLHDWIAGIDPVLEKALSSG